MFENTVSRLFLTRKVGLGKGLGNLVKKKNDNSIKLNVSKHFNTSFRIICAIYICTTQILAFVTLTLDKPSVDTFVESLDIR